MENDGSASMRAKSSTTKINHRRMAYASCCLAITALSVLVTAPAESKSEKVLYTFCLQSGCADGAVPEGGLIRDNAGNFYGTTYFGGQLSNDCANGGWCGVVFKLAPDGTETVLHTFTGPDGANPIAGLIADSTGIFYGTTIVGGTAGDGTVFKLTPDGTETVLYSFQGGSDGFGPASTLIVNKDGSLFGTTELGGSSANCLGRSEGCGTAFEVKSDGTEKVLYAFQGGADGGIPIAGLIRENGTLYGTTEVGGVSCEGYTQGCGTVFKLTAAGTETVLHAFRGGSDGVGPWSTLIADKNGNLYGTTAFGGGGAGCGGDCGTIFRLTPDGTETVLYAFQGGSDGANPLVGLIADKAGNLYGTTGSGGHSCIKRFCGGTVFKLAPDGTETVLHAFRSRKGNYPQAPLYMDRKGALIGTASGGGKNNEGVVFLVR